MDKLNLIQVFLSVARLGSFAATSAEMGVDPSTVSKSIGLLEKHLSLRLFNRTTRRLQLTTAGETYRQTCSHLLSGLSQCEAQLHSEQHLPKGLLRINMPVAYGQLYVMPMLGRFCERYPDVQLDVSLSDDYIDIVSHSIDVAIRSGTLEDSNLIARKLSPMDFISCATPELIDQFGPVTKDNIEGLPWVLYKFIHSGRLMPLFSVEGGEHGSQKKEIMPESRITVTDGQAMMQAACSGIGLVQAPHFLVRDAILQNKLVPIDSYYRHEQFSIYAYYLNKGYLPARVKVFLDFLREELDAIGENHESTFLSNLSR